MLSSYFQRLGFSGNDLEIVCNAFERRLYEKNDWVAEEGKISRHIGLVENGMFQYFVNKDGEERTTYVSVSGTWLASVRSFISETPCQENIRALTSGSLYLIAKSSLKTLVEQLPAFKEFYITLLEQSLCGIDESRHNLIVLSAEQRYETLLRQEPHLLQQIPLQHLASMLGITPRHMSRIRRQIR